MTAKAAQKIIDGLAQLLEGFAELEQLVAEDFLGSGSAISDDEDETKAEIETAIVQEIKAAVESVLESENYETEELATLISAFTEALEEIDPEVFVSPEEIASDDVDEEDLDVDEDEDDEDEEEDDDEDEDEDEEDDDEK